MRFLVLVLAIAVGELLPLHSQNNQSAALNLWNRGVREPLQGPNGRQCFESTLKGAFLPAGAAGMQAFRGSVVSSTPAGSPGILAITLQGAANPEVTVRLVRREGPVTLVAPVPKGSTVNFNGEVTGYTLSPFMVTMDVEPEQLGLARYTELVEQVLPPLIVALAE